MGLALTLHVYTCLSVVLCLSFLRIVQQFENIVEALIQQENFTNISVVTEDIALVGERMSVVHSLITTLDE